MSFKITETDIKDLIIIESTLNKDSRGRFIETYKSSAFSNLNLNFNFVQDNVSNSRKHVLRGLHFQKNPHAQGKLVTTLSGEIFDVVVDIREKSPTFGKVSCNILSSKDSKSLYVPGGFAHGFLSMSDNTIVHYKTTKEYNPNFESGILWSDNDLNIDWPTSKPLVSEKDLSLPNFKDILINK